MGTTKRIHTPSVEPSDQRDPTAEPSPAQARNPLPELRPLEPAITQTDADTPAAEERVTPLSQQAPLDLANVDPQLLATEQSRDSDLRGEDIPETIEATAAETISAQQSSHPPGVTEREFDMNDVEDWLDDFENNRADRRQFSEVGSIPTSMATDTCTTRKLYKGCRCPEHQEIYNNWPTRNAEMTIAHCMRICMYCGKDFPDAPKLRKHLRKRKEYIRRNLRVPFEPRGRWGNHTPNWKPREPRTRTTRSLSPPFHRPRTWGLRSRSPIDRPSAEIPQC
ncbi:hypothetical protein TESG_07290 [Trichophyton tonsurans CBS 112818]|uniref:Uncharacterized protein n=1 Tax=Trichophyton tonsurans (strain CBS 112818) TaxID=647933 RepID=F2S8R3_TRIT1|nr:hypothetical protein TESG_07290 [Trichophyton tonsurans CBS 112818]